MFRSRSNASPLLGIALLPLLAMESASVEGRGRFVAGKWQIPGWVFDGGGFRPDAPGAERIAFSEGLPAPQEESVDPRRAILRTGDRVLTPRRLRFDLTDVGPLLECPKGLSLAIPSTQAPYLTWREGSVGPGVPTPDVAWLAVSFREGGAPFVIGVSGNPAAFRLDGRPGAWVLRTLGKPNLGWVRFGSPYGSASFATNSAATLGRLALRAAAGADLWRAAPADLLATEISDDVDGVTVTWRFSRPGVVVPNAVFLARGGGYGARILTPVERTDWPLPIERGEPSQRLVLTRSAEFSVRLPVRRIPRGRAVTAGSGPPFAPPLGFSPRDMAPFSFSLLFAARSAEAPGAALRAMGASLAGSDVSPERQAMLALLAACLVASQTDADPDPLYAGVSGWRDWRTGSFVGASSTLGARRAAVLAALAGAFSSDPRRRAAGALFEAGLAAERGFRTLIAVQRGEETPKLIEPFGALRRSLFGYDSSGGEDPFFGALRSPIRVVGAPAVSWEAGTLRSVAPAQGSVSFRLYGAPGPYPGGGVQADGSIGFSVALAPGETWSLNIGDVRVPPSAPIPIWDETPR